MAVWPGGAPQFDGNNDAFDTKAERISFGNNYSQRFGESLNGPDRKLSYTFRMNGAEKAVVKAFLEARDGVEAFDFTPPDETTIKVTCPKWNFKRVSRMNDLFDLVLTFQKENDL